MMTNTTTYECVSNRQFDTQLIRENREYAIMVFVAKKMAEYDSEIARIRAEENEWADAAAAAMAHLHVGAHTQHAQRNAGKESDPEWERIEDAMHVASAMARARYAGVMRSLAQLKVD